MNSEHMCEIVQNLIEYFLCNTKFDKEFVKSKLEELGWTEFDMKFFNIDWMFKGE